MSAGIKNTFNNVPLAAEFKGCTPERQVWVMGVNALEIHLMSSQSTCPASFVLLFRGYGTRVRSLANLQCAYTFQQSQHARISTLTVSTAVFPLLS